MKIALFLLLIVGMTLSFAAIGLVMLYATGTVKSLDEAKNLFIHGEARSDSSLVAPDEVGQVQDALAQLQLQRQELDKMLEEMRADTANLTQRKTAIQKEIESILPDSQRAQQKKSALRLEQLAQLVKLYDTMKPADAAAVMDRMDMDLVLEILPKLKLRQQAKILAAMEDESRKVQITEMLAGKKPEAGAASSGTPVPQAGI